MFNKTPPKGMRDFLPDEVEFRNSLIEQIKQSYHSFGFRQIETPCVEDLSLLTSKQGGDNEKLIYKILKRGEKLDRADGELADLGLRFDLTLPLARYYCNNVGNLPTVVKATNIGNVFRAERPQRGRYRQLVQCDIDILNEGSILAEIELITATKATLAKIGFPNCTIKINDRRVLTALAQYCGFVGEECDKMFITLDKLDKIGQEGVVAELLSWADRSKIDRLTDAISTIRNADDSLARCMQTLVGAEEYLNNLANIIDATGAVFDITLVRGMNYYTGTIFEAYTSEESFAVGGGGRYDKLIEKISGVSTPACGFSIGFERVALILSERSKYESEPLTALLIGKEDLPDIVKITALVTELRKSQSCSLFMKSKNVRYQMETLTKNGYKTILTYNANTQTFEGR